MIRAIVVVFLIALASPLRAQDLREWDGFIAPLTPEKLEELRSIDAHSLPVVRDGRSRLEWNLHPDAAAYRIKRGDGEVVYEGRIPRAFVSGLTNGEYEFHLEALGSEGELIAVAPTPAVVIVEHYPMWMGFALFALGAVVFSAIVVLLLVGQFRFRTSIPQNGQDA